MIDGKLIIEIYEYRDDDLNVPPFEFYPCDLDVCLKKRKATLREIIEKCFDNVPKKSQDLAKRQEILAQLEAAGIGKINVEYHPASGNEDPYIQMTNVMKISMADADARRVKTNKGDIILYGQYRMSEGNDTTKLRDSQRLTLIYSSAANEIVSDEMPDDPEERDVQKEICLNITFIQG